MRYYHSENPIGPKKSCWKTFAGLATILVRISPCIFPCIEVLEEAEDYDKEDKDFNDKKVNAERRARIKFPPTKTTQLMFAKYDSEFYDKKESFVDE